jgi:hypothetical protein
VIRLTLALAVLAGPAAAAAAADLQRFDLTCELTETSSLKPGVSTPITRHLSVDLTARRWCLRDEGCRELLPVAKVTAREFHLADVDDDTTTRTTVIDRRTWRWVNRATLKRPVRATGGSEGVCKVAAFTPFPRERA